jgi:molybdate transport system substrate-binding protein
MGENTRFLYFILEDNKFFKIEKRLSIQMSNYEIENDANVIKGLASIALEGASKIVKDFESETDFKVQFDLIPSADITVLLSKGNKVDFVFYPTKPIQKFTSDGILVADGFTPVVQSGIGIAVPMSSNLKAPKNAQELKEILLAANTIIYATGPSGDHMETVIDQLQIRSEIKNKIKIISGLVAKGIERGEGDIGFQQIPEILLVPGAKLLSPLPPDVQLLTPFSLCVHASSTKSHICKALFHYLNDSKYRDLYSSCGFQMI